MLEAGGAGVVRGLHRAAGRVPPVEDGEDVLGGGLHAEADPGESAVAQLGEVRRVDGLGVGLGGDLDVGGHREEPAHRGQHGGEVGGGQQGRGAAADEHRRDRRQVGAEDAGRPAQLVDRRPRVLGAAGAGPELVGGVGVEVAVAAARRAERHVHVEAERRASPAPRGRTRAASSGRARRVGRSSGRTVFICSQCAAPRAAGRQDAAVTHDRVIQVTVSAGVATLTLDSPENRNALSKALRGAAPGRPRRRARRRRRAGGRARPHRPRVLLRHGPRRGRRRLVAGPGRQRVPRAAAARLVLPQAGRRRRPRARPGRWRGPGWPRATSSSPPRRPASPSPRSGWGWSRR